MLWNYLKERMLQNKHQMISEKSRSVTYEEAIVFAETFAKIISHEKCCAVYCNSELNAGLVILSCIAANVTAVPLSKRYGEKHCQKILNKISPSCVIADLNGKLDIYRISDSQYTQPDIKPAFIMCTSGTSGEPKGVMLSCENIISNLEDISEYFQIGINDEMLITRTLYHSAVLTGEFLYSLIKGVNIYFYSELLNMQKLIDIFRTRNISVFCGTPTLINSLLLNLTRKHMISLKNMVISGECLSAVDGLFIREKFPYSKIYHVYGLTEASPRVCYMPPEFYDEAIGCVGKPLKSVSVEIRDMAGNCVGVGEKGMLWIKGPSVMIGYYNDPEMTDKVLKNGWLCTGDIAEITSKGWIKICGRSDNMIIRAGMNIYPAEIENELKKDSRVHQVKAYGINNKVAVEIVGDFNDESEVKSLCIDVLPAYQIPSKIKLVDKIKTTESGKLIRTVNKNA